MSKNPASARRESADHRTRVGRERRARTRAGILEAALGVFAAKGADAAVIDDFIRAAGVSRGTFYNHYASVAELLEATQRWLEDDLIVSIDMEIRAFEDPAERLANGVRLWLRMAAAHPDWCAFAVRLRHHGESVEQHLTSDLRAGRASGAFAFADLKAARDLVIGTVQEAMTRMTGQRVSRAYLEGVARAILGGLGMDERAAAKLLARPPPTMRRPAKSFATSASPASKRGARRG